MNSTGVSTYHREGLHDRRDLDDWLEESSLHGDVAETATQGMCERVIVIQRV